MAKIVTEFEAKEFVSVNAGYSDMLKPMSHVTLLKNKKYREVLEQAFDFETYVECSNTVSVAEYEALKYRCAGLESKIALLEQTIRNLDAGVGGLEYRVAETANGGVEGDSSDAAFLLDLLDDLKGELHDAIETIFQGALHDCWLFVDFLEHVVAIFALVSSFGAITVLHGFTLKDRKSTRLNSSHVF